jgi:NDP-sugar pyrophosphorylase family protein
VKALILAGGLGTRLRPLTYTRPKHLLPIVNRPQIEHTLDLLLRHGIDDVVVLTSHMADLFEPVHRMALDRGITLRLSREHQRLGTGGAIKNAADMVDDEPFFVFNGDIATDIDLSRVAGFHRDRSAEATIVLTPVADPSAFGVVPTDESGAITAFIEKPKLGEAPTNLINCGIYMLEPTILDRIPPDEVWSAERSLFPQLVDEGAPIFGCATDSYWMDVGTTERYLQVNMDALLGKFRTETTTEPERHEVIDPSAVVDDGASIQLSSVGAQCLIGADALVEGSVLLPGAAVGRGARVSGSVLGQRVVVAPGARVKDRAIGDGRLVTTTGDHITAAVRRSEFA